MEDDDKPDPDELLKAIKKEEEQRTLGRLKIFFGMSAGVGKTYAMLQEGQRLLKEGVNVVVGTVETHGRQETEELLKGLPIIPEKWIKYKDIAFEEFDLESVLAAKPQVVLVDELAHSNVPGSKHPKRWQDVIEILNAGIDVYTCLNVQHIESRKDIVENLTGIQIRECVPDLVLERSHSIELIDITPPDLLQRLREGKVYLGEQSKLAAKHFFQEESLMALREIALRLTAEKIDHDLHNIVQGKGWKTRERLMIAVTPHPATEQLIRVGRRIAFEIDAPLFAVYVDNGTPLSSEDQAKLNKYFNVARDLGAEVITTHDLDVVSALQRIAKQKDITRILIDRTQNKKSGFLGLFKGSFIDRLESYNKNTDIMILKQDKSSEDYEETRAIFESKSTQKDYWLALAVVVGILGLGYLLSPLIGYKSVGFVFLFAILGLSFFVGRGPIFFAAMLSALAWGGVFLSSSFFQNQKPDAEDITFVGVYFVIAAIAGSLTSRMREQERFLQEREEKSERLYEIEREIANAINFQYLRLNVCSHLDNMFPGKFDILTKSTDNEIIIDSHLPFLQEEKEKATVTWVFKNGKIGGWSTDTLPSSEGMYFPIKFSKATNGVLVYQPKDRPFSLDEINFLQTVTQQLGVYIERYVFEERVSRQNYSRQFEKVHESIYSSLSQTFSEPLEKISAIIQEVKTKLDSKDVSLVSEIDLLIASIKFTVSNVIAINEVQSGFIHYEPQKSSPKALVHEVLEDLRLFSKNHAFEVRLPPDNIRLPFDHNLIKLAVENLILNAINFTPAQSNIIIEVKLLEGEFSISIIDEGAGIQDEIMPLIFNKFYHDTSMSKGLGLGLSIVKSVVDVHRGRIEVKKRVDKPGTDFSIILPN